ncbi:MAG: nucleoid-associated protein [Erysipelothrix sp.]|nr:nucleoid-associated protein [Erysipelothrix sp.]
MQVTKVVVHSVDNSLATVVLSKRQINLNQNAELDGFILKLYKGLMKSSGTSSGVLEEESLLNEYIGEEFNFMAVSTTLAQAWFDHYEATTKHTALNLVFAMVHEEETVSFVMFEVASRSGFVRILDEDDNDIEHSLGIMSDSLASVKTAFAFDLNTGDLKVKHNNNTQLYLEELLGFKTIPNAKKSLEILDAMVDYVSEKRQENVLDNTIKSKQMIIETAELFEEVEPKRILDNVFPDLDEDEQTFVNETFEETFLPPLIVSADVSRLSARKKHKINTELGIEVTIPLDSLIIEDILEVKENLDGSVDIILKNIGGIV